MNSVAANPRRSQSQLKKEKTQQSKNRTVARDNSKNSLVPISRKSARRESALSENEKNYSIADRDDSSTTPRGQRVPQINRSVGSRRTTK